MLKWKTYTICTPDNPRLGDVELVRLQRILGYHSIKAWDESLMVHRSRGETAAFLRRARKAIRETDSPA